MAGPYRGTSSLIMGWREDFSMSFRLMPSQPLAAEHLADLMRQSSMPYRLGGRSKGGNLTVYAAMLLPSDFQARVQTVYNNDGPGRCPDHVDMAPSKAKAVLNMGAMCAFMYLVAQKTQLLHFSNLIMGAVFLYYAYRQAQNGFFPSRTPPARAACAVQGVLAFLLGIVPILTADITLWRYVFSAGCIIMFLGVGKILYAMYRDGKEKSFATPLYDLKH